MTKRDAKRRVALHACLYVTLNLGSHESLYPEDCTDADTERITDAIRELGDRLAEQAGPEYYLWRRANQRLVDRAEKSRN